MKEKVYVLQKNVWKGANWAAAVIIKIDTFPSYDTKGILAELLTFSEQYNASLELIANSSVSKKNTADYSILVRKEGSSPSQTINELGKLAQIIVSRLDYAGFQVTVLSKEETAAYKDYFIKRKNTLLCTPAETCRKVNFCYAPGGYSIVQNMDLSYLLSIISKNAEAGISVQICPTKFFEKEEKNIVDNLNWLSNFDKKVEVRNAMEAFLTYYKMGKERVYFLTISIWGDDHAMMGMSGEFRKCGYELLVLPEDISILNDYVLLGNTAVSIFAIEKGHVLNQKMRIPFGCERLNYLIDQNGIQQMFSSLQDFSACPSIPVSEKVNLVEDIPEELLKNDGLEIGMVNEKEKITLPMDQLSKHMVIGGMPGSGKTTFLFQILYELSRKNIPFLAIEPTKSEYRELLDVIPDLKILTPGKTDLCPIMFNPFIPPKGVSLEQFLPSLEASFQMAFSLTTPLDVIFTEVLRNCYAEYGWRNNSTSDDPEVTCFGMHEFICAFKTEIEKSGYDPESKNNLLSGGVYRFLSLINSNPYLFDTDKSLSVEDLLKGHTLIEFDAIDNNEQKSLILSLLLLQIKLVIRNTQRKDSKLKNVLVIDEAHVLLGQGQVIAKKNESNPAGKIREYLLAMVKENRAYGTGMVFADQSLSLMKDFVDNSNIKVAMHLETREDRLLLKDNLNLSIEVCNHIANLHIGQYYLAYEKLEKPLLIQAPNIRKDLSLKSDMDDEELRSRVRVVFEKPFQICPCKKACDMEIRNEAEFIARKLYNKVRNQLTDRDSAENFKKECLVDALYQMTEDSDNPKKLMKCAKIMTERMIDLKVG